MSIQINQSQCNLPNLPPFYQLMLVTNKQNTPLNEYLKFIDTCAKSGITAVQLREKNMPYTELLQFGQKIQAILAPFTIPLIINDNVKLAIALDATGVHLGQTDHCPKKARTQLGKQKIIGVSIDSMDNLLKANQLPIDYVGIGSIFPTKNKSNVVTYWGIEGLQKLAPLSTHPIVAIGGINERNAINIIQAGAHGIAAIEAFHQTMNLPKTTQQLLHMTRGKHHDSFNSIQFNSSSTNKTFNSLSD